MAYDYRSAMGRADAPKGSVAIALVGLAIVVCFAAFALICSRTDEQQPTIRHDSLAPTYTHDGEVIRWYVLVDPDTSVQYLVNDRGGCCPRLDRYGNPIGTTVYE